MSDGQPAKPHRRTTDQLAQSLKGLGKAEAAEALEALEDAAAAAVLQSLNPAVAGDIIGELTETRRESMFRLTPRMLPQWGCCSGWRRCC